ncbi:MAG: gamma-glutamylcyclotransferase [Deltaproteobacteria bacterium]|nr:gamma-glutamylcyclotransferase [Deltaproteobacteria bacterium]
MNDPTWIFGYGSLIWRQDFPYLDAGRAYVEGWTRRFWQGSHDHRGVQADPGRTVTLVEAAGERCYGRAFLIELNVFEHLDYREKNGYERRSIKIHFGDSHVTGVVYTAANTNPAFLGDAPLDEMVAQINRCAGQSGTNLEYLLQLARALRKLNISDPHVFELEARVLATQDALNSK